MTHSGLLPDLLLIAATVAGMVWAHRKPRHRLTLREDGRPTWFGDVR
jgi:hypothetical protein